MAAEFTQGFFVRVPAWHGLGVVLDHYPGREEAMQLAGHNWDVIEVPSFTGIPAEVCAQLGLEPNKGNGHLRKDEGWKSHLRSDTGALLHKSLESYHRIPNSVAYELAELLLGEGFQYETGITLKDGALCALTLLLDEPYQIPGDDSEVLQYVGIDWAHNGSAALGVNPTSVRRVCANTVSASIAEGEALGRRISIKHTKNWRARVEDAKKVLEGVRAQSDAQEALGLELASYFFEQESIQEFIERFTTPPEVLSASMVSKRVASNIVTAQGKITAIWQGQTVPEAHKGTGWGLYNAAVEYLDFARRSAGNADSPRTKSEALVQRTLLSPNKAKDGAVELIRTMVAEGRARKTVTA
jgi:phage/plasmid-like protein (TIGR03299 family)